MHSNQDLQNKPLKKPPDPYRFLLRSICIDSKTNAFKNCCVKGFFLKKLIACSTDYTAFFSDNKRSFSQVFRNKKIHKTLRQVEIRSDFPHFVHYCLKNSKSLQNYTLENSSSFLSPLLSSTFRKLPANIKNVSFSIDYHLKTMNREIIYSIGRCIRRLPNLQSFQRGSFDHNDECTGYVGKELAIYSRSVAKLQMIRRMIFCVRSGEYYSLQKTMKKGVVYKGISGLKLFFWHEQDSQEMTALLNNEGETFLDFEEDVDFSQQEILIRAFLENEDEYPLIAFGNMAPLQQEIYKRIKNVKKEEDKAHAIKAKEDDINWPVKTIPDKIDSDNVSGNEEQEINPKFWAICRMTEEVRPFYRFELFPDLKELILAFEGFGSALGSFVIDGFCALKNLENLKVTMQQRFIGASFLFKAFLELPLLKKLTFSTKSLNNEEWALFGHFIHVQDKIEELSLDVRKGFSNKTHYLKQNANLKSTLKYLKNHLSLKFLHLEFSYFSLEALSEGLSHLKMVNQFHTFKIKVCDDILTSQKKASERVEGFCQFLKNQKKSLKVFHITLKFAVEDILVTHIAEAVSQLSALKELHFECNWHVYKRWEYFRVTLQKDIELDLRKKLFSPKRWNPSLARYFQKLTNLESFVFCSQTIATEENDSSRWVIDLISILPDLEKLRNLEIYFATWKDNKSFKNARPMLVDRFLCLPRIKNIFVNFFDDDDDDSSVKQFDLKEICEMINQRQARKNDYMFD